VADIDELELKFINNK